MRTRQIAAVSCMIVDRYGHNLLFSVIPVYSTKGVLLSNLWVTDIGFQVDCHVVILSNNFILIRNIGHILTNRLIPVII